MPTAAEMTSKDQKIETRYLTRKAYKGQRSSDFVALNCQFSDF